MGLRALLGCTHYDSVRVYLDPLKRGVSKRTEALWPDRAWATVSSWQSKVTILFSPHSLGLLVLKCMLAASVIKGKMQQNSPLLTGQSIKGGGISKFWSSEIESCQIFLQMQLGQFRMWWESSIQPHGRVSEKRGSGLTNRLTKAAGCPWFWDLTRSGKRTPFETTISLKQAAVQVMLF